MKARECSAVVVSLLASFLEDQAVCSRETSSGQHVRGVAHNQMWQRCQTLLELVRARPALSRPLADLVEAADDKSVRSRLESRLADELARDEDLLGAVWTEMLREEGRHVMDMGTVILSPLTDSGYVLDIGGGGEGVIGRLAAGRVVAIDASRRELEEAPDGPLKIVMKAGDLRFLDNSFETATCFFSLMYLRAEDRWDAMQQVARVLRPGGRLLVWGAEIPPWTPEAPEWLVLPLHIQLPDDDILTGYGVSWEGREQSVEAVRALGQATGLDCVLCQSQGGIFHLEMRKRATAQ